MYSVRVCVPWQEGGETVQICKNIVGMFHCVAMCPETSCCAENKCERVLSHPSASASLPARRTAVIHNVNFLVALALAQ